MKLRTNHLLILALLLVCISAGLYLPWRNNPLVFDDLNLYGSSLLYYAAAPFSLETRHFAYFSLAFENVVSGGNLQVSRYVTLVLHALNGLLLLLLAQRLLGTALTPRRSFMTALLLAIGFVAHPVAVYGVAYLIQRPILLATLFLLLSALQFQKALAERSSRRALMAGVCYGLAVLSKEHAITGIISVLGLMLLDKTPDWRKTSPLVLAFLSAAIPIAAWVTAQKLGLVGTTYEPDAQAMISATGFPDAGSRLGNWLLSAELQCRFFFRYLGSWWWPDPAGMSIDIRPDLRHLSQFPIVMFGPVAFGALAGTVAYALWSAKVRPALKLSAYGMLWAMSLFLIELSTVRFQEPIVLYRSYLWAPGFLLALAALVSLIPARAASALATVSLLVIVPLSWGRLDGFSDELKLWQEAALKLPQTSSPGAIRIHYNLGLFLARDRQLDKALLEFDWVVRQDPMAFPGYWGRSSVRLARNELALALEDLRTMVQLKPDSGTAYFQLGLLLKKMGKTEEGQIALAKAETLGAPHVDFK